MTNVTVFVVLQISYQLCIHLSHPNNNNLDRIIAFTCSTGLISTLSQLLNVFKH